MMVSSTPNLGREDDYQPVSIRGEKTYLRSCRKSTRTEGYCCVHNAECLSSTIFLHIHQRNVAEKNWDIRSGWGVVYDVESL